MRGRLFSQSGKRISILKRFRTEQPRFTVDTIQPSAKKPNYIIASMHDALNNVSFICYLCGYLTNARCRRRNRNDYNCLRHELGDLESNRFESCDMRGGWRSHGSTVAMLAISFCRACNFDWRSRAVEVRDLRRDILSGPTLIVVLIDPK